MKCRWQVRRTVWLWSLFYDNELVASADDPLELLLYAASLRGCVHS